MGIDGKLEMDGCEVIYPGQDFLSSWNMMIKNTSFLINPCHDAGIRIQSVLAPRVIAAHGKAKFEGCSFMEEAGNSAPTSKLDLIRLDVANINNYTFKNITGKIEVNTISGCFLLDAPMLVVQKSAVLPLLIAEAFHPRTRAATLGTATLTM